MNKTLNLIIYLTKGFGKSSYRFYFTKQRNAQKKKKLTEKKQTDNKIISDQLLFCSECNMLTHLAEHHIWPQLYI